MNDNVVISIYQYLEKYREKSTCNKRKIASALVFSDRAYFAANGSPADPCTAKGREYCTRKGDDFTEMPEYDTCPSPCAEGSVNIGAKVDRVKEKGILISTDFPCERCTNIMIDAGIVSALYFGSFKNGEPRPREIIYGSWLAKNNIAIHWFSDSKRYSFEDEVKSLMRDSFLNSSIRTPGYVYLDHMKGNGIKARPERVKLLWTPKSELITIPF